MAGRGLNRFRGRQWSGPNGKEDGLPPVGPSYDVASKPEPPDHLIVGSTEGGRRVQEEE